MPNLLRLMRHARPHRRKLWAGVAVGVSGMALSAVTPLLTKDVIDKGIRSGNGRRLVMLIGAVVLVGATRAVFNGLRRRLSGENAVLVEGDLRDALYEHVQALDIGYHERVSTGQLMSRASSDLQAIRFFYMVIPFSVGLILQFFVVMTVMFALEPRLAAVAAAPLPLMIWPTVRYLKQFDLVVGRLQQALGDFASLVEETVTGIRVVKAFGREAEQVQRAEHGAARVFAEAMATIRLRAFVGPLFTLLPQISMVLVLWVGGRQVIAGTTTLGTLVAFTAYLTILAWPIRALGWILSSARRAATASGRVFEVLETRPGVSDRPEAVKLPRGPGRVTYEDVHYSYPGGGPVLAGVDLNIEPGTSLALVGPTGCGKSTLIRLLLRFIEPVSGRIGIDGTDVSTATLHSLRSRIGIVFEDPFLFSDSIKANIAFGRPDARDDEVVRAAVTAQAHEFIEELSDGYDSVVGEHGYTLSGGQRQRVAIARAILMDPQVLILDDATSSLDARVEEAIRAGLRQAMSGRTTLIVARRASTASLADRVAFMIDGRIAAIASHDELWATNEQYREALVSGTSVDEIRGKSIGAAS
ncbi:MAG TPA: ABC transporter ATP-binding protein [Actinomycetota bacterium]|nr:ABC transporter ATP-binding protein [Actinomycetota bacterium]